MKLCKPIAGEAVRDVALEWLGRFGGVGGAAVRSSSSRNVLRHSCWDLLLILLAGCHATALVVAPSIPVVALGMWWNANTIAHNFIHLPFFTSRRLNAAFSVALSLLIGVPQRLWRDRHLAHHADRPMRLRWSRQLAVESGVIAALWVTLLVVTPEFLLTVYLPGWLVGLGLCQLQSHYEHVRGTVSHYGKPYNLLFFNDGFHVEHHARPATHWTELPRFKADAAHASRWPAVFRWLECLSLDSLEYVVIRSPVLQRFVLKRHECAVRQLLAHVRHVRRITIIGGGIFPRSALIFRRLLPDAKLTIIDANPASIASARKFLGNGEVEFVNAFFKAPEETEADLLVIPLAFVGDRTRVYERPGPAAMLVHDWIWRARGQSTVVSWPLLKRLNLVTA